MPFRAQIEYDRWLSKILERDVHRLSIFRYLAKASESTEEGLATVLPAGPAFVYAKVDVGDLDGVSLLESYGFRLIETSVELEKAVASRGPFPCQAQVRYAETKDKPGVDVVARGSFRYSRFHMDPKIPDQLADEVKARWATNYFGGNRGDNMIVGVVKKEVAGFLQLLYGENRVLVIDLIAVGAKFQRRGIASGMIAYAESHIRGFEKIRVGTQITNLPSLRLYEGMGFRLTGANYIFHYFQG